MENISIKTVASMGAGEGLTAGEQEQKTMTTRELAEQLGCEVKTIMNNAKKYLPNKVIENGKPTMWTEAEATMLIEGMKGNQTKSTDLVKTLQGTTTSLTKDLHLSEASAMFSNAVEEGDLDDDDIEKYQRALAAMNESLINGLHRRNQKLEEHNKQLKAENKELLENRINVHCVFSKEFKGYRGEVRDMLRYGQLRLEGQQKYTEHRMYDADTGTYLESYDEFRFLATKANRLAILEALHAAHPRVPTDVMAMRVPEKLFS